MTHEKIASHGISLSVFENDFSERPELESDFEDLNQSQDWVRSRDAGSCLIEDD